PHGCGRDVGRSVDQALGRCDRRHRVVEAFGRPVTAPYIEHHGAVTTTNRDFRSHAIGPKAVDLAGLKRLRGGDAEVDAGPARPWHRSDLNAVAFRIDTGADEQLAKPHFDPWRRADPTPPNHLEVTSRGLEVRAHDQKPIHALRLRADEPDPVPFRKRGERRMS